MEIYYAGLKPSSIVDVIGKITTTIWLCGCALKCPYCHNWRIATWQGCKKVKVNDLATRLLEDPTSHLVDFIHVTGGEPLLQPYSLRELVRETKLQYSINTSLVVSPRALDLVLKEDNVVHVAFDVKVPFEVLTGTRLFELFKDNLARIEDYNVDVEARFPISTFLTPKALDSFLSRLIKEKKRWRAYAFPLTREHLSPRDPSWRGYKERLSKEEKEEYERVLKKYFERVLVKPYWFFLMKK